MSGVNSLIPQAKIQLVEFIFKTGRIGTYPSKEKLEAIDLNGWGRGLKYF